MAPGSSDRYGGGKPGSFGGKDHNDRRGRGRPGARLMQPSVVLAKEKKAQALKVAVPKPVNLSSMKREYTSTSAETGQDEEKKGPRGWGTADSVSYKEPAAPKRMAYDGYNGPRRPEHQAPRYNHRASDFPTLGAAEKAPKPKPQYEVPEGDNSNWADDDRALQRPPTDREDRGGRFGRGGRDDFDPGFPSGGGGRRDHDAGEGYGGRWDPRNQPPPRREPRGGYGGRDEYDDRPRGEYGGGGGGPGRQEGYGGRWDPRNQHRDHGRDRDGYAADRRSDRDRGGRQEGYGGRWDPRNQQRNGGGRGHGGGRGGPGGHGPDGFGGRGDPREPPAEAAEAFGRDFTVQQPNFGNLSPAVKEREDQPFVKHEAEIEQLKEAALRKYEQKMDLYGTDPETGWGQGMVFGNGQGTEGPEYEIPAKLRKFLFRECKDGLDLASLRRDQHNATGCPDREWKPLFSQSKFREHWPDGLPYLRGLYRPPPPAWDGTGRLPDGQPLQTALYPDAPLAVPGANEPRAHPERDLTYDQVRYDAEYGWLPKDPQAEAAIAHGLWPIIYRGPEAPAPAGFDEYIERKKARGERVTVKPRDAKREAFYAELDAMAGHDNPLEGAPGGREKTVLGASKPKKKPPRKKAEPAAAPAAAPAAPEPASAIPGGPLLPPPRAEREKAAAPAPAPVLAPQTVNLSTLRSGLDQPPAAPCASGGGMAALQRLGGGAAAPAAGHAPAPAAGGAYPLGVAAAEAPLRGSSSEPHLVNYGLWQGGAHDAKSLQAGMERLGAGWDEGAAQVAAGPAGMGMQQGMAQGMQQGMQQGMPQGMPALPDNLSISPGMGGFHHYGAAAYAASAEQQRAQVPAYYAPPEPSVGYFGQGAQYFGGQGAQYPHVGVDWSLGLGGGMMMGSGSGGAAAQGRFADPVGVGGMYFGAPAAGGAEQDLGQAQGGAGPPQVNDR